ncbi:hypothetical protein ACFY1P_08020 [Streptomyces sp. NPDC001407]|uniref:hypothetical protein n=1 Tax=Streptomyces sp. NPDC001407 TaxID=3364573 RepID=UPI00367AA58C
MIIKPTGEQIADMWWRGRDNGQTLVILAHTPEGEEIQGDVMGRGSMMWVRNHETGQSWEDVRHEWVYSATLVNRKGGDRES